jgi:hypothetical protein
MPIVQAAYIMVMLQAFAPDNKIVTDFGYNTTTRRNFVSKNFTIPSVPLSPKN